MVVAEMTLSTSYSPENHGVGYKQMLQKDRLGSVC
jgi:hypothetical protein